VLHHKKCTLAKEPNVGSCARSGCVPVRASCGDLSKAMCWCMDHGCTDAHVGTHSLACSVQICCTLRLWSSPKCLWLSNVHLCGTLGALGKFADVAKSWTDIKIHTIDCSKTALSTVALKVALSKDLLKNAQLQVGAQVREVHQQCNAQHV